MPEVETVRKTLAALTLNKKIKHVTVWYPNIIDGDSHDFAQKVKGKTILKIDRYAKFLLIRLSDNYTIVSHLRMEGKYHLVKNSTPKDKHDHVEFSFSDGTSLRYNDVRKFGRMQLVITGTERKVTGLSKLGPEALSREFSSDYFIKALKKKKKNIKNTLLDQTVVSGLGNIYVDECLWQAKIHPESLAEKIPALSVKLLHEAINQTIAEAIKFGGTTVHSFLNAAGKTGLYQEHLKVYGHAGQACPRCGEKLKKIKVNGRGTTFCPSCQKEYK